MMNIIHTYLHTTNCTNCLAKSCFLVLSGAYTDYCIWDRFASINKFEKRDGHHNHMHFTRPTSHMTSIGSTDQRHGKSPSQPKRLVWTIGNLSIPQFRALDANIVGSRWLSVGAD